MNFYRTDSSLCTNKSSLIRLRYDKRFGGKKKLKFNCKRAKQVLFWGKFNETFRIDAPWCGINMCLIKLRYDKRFAGKTEFKFN
jgi:hypothetical protein